MQYDHHVRAYYRRIAINRLAFPWVRRAASEALAKLAAAQLGVTP